MHIDIFKHGYMPSLPARKKRYESASLFLDCFIFSYYPANYDGCEDSTMKINAKLQQINQKLIQLIQEFKDYNKGNNICLKNCQADPENMMLEIGPPSNFVYPLI